MTEPYEDCIRVARAELAMARQYLQDEISAYPSPISGCDAQFNHLLGERQRVLAAIRSLEEAVFVPTPRTLTPGAGIESR